MIYLTGSSGPAVRAVARSRGIGLMVQPGTGVAQIEHYRLWAADNGCFNPDYLHVACMAWQRRPTDQAYSAMERAYNYAHRVDLDRP